MSAQLQEVRASVPNGYDANLLIRAGLHRAITDDLRHFLKYGCGDAWVTAPPDELDESFDQEMSLREMAQLLTGYADAIHSLMREASEAHSIAKIA